MSHIQYGNHIDPMIITYNAECLMKPEFPHSVLFVKFRQGRLHRFRVAILHKLLSYSLACEMRGEVQGTVNRAVLHDIAIFKEWYNYDFRGVMDCLDAWEFELVLDYDSCERESKVYNRRICKRICDLTEQLRQDRSPEAMKATLTEFYKEYGVGKLGQARL